LYLAGRTTITGLWDALVRGTDLNPPLYYIAVKLCMQVLGEGALATRLPALLGFVAASLALFVFMRRRAGVTVAVMAAIIPSLTGAYRYSFNGRPYGLVLGLCAMALVAWQARGLPGSHRLAPVLCAVSIAAAISTHYYAVLMLPPLAAGELARTLIRKQVDWTMALAIVLGLTPLVLFRPLIVGTREFAAAFWSPGRPADLLMFYLDLSSPLGLLLFGAACGLTLAILWNRFVRASAPPTASSTPADPILSADEIVVALALAALPVFGFALALITGAFHGRYVLPAVLGVAILIGWWTAAGLRDRRFATVFVGVLFLAFAARQMGSALGIARGPADHVAPYRQILSRAEADAPVVASRALTFLPMAHYLAGPERARVIYLTRPADVVRQDGADTGSRALRLLSQVVPLNVEDYDAFVAAHDRFYLYGPTSWLTQKLLRDHAELRLLFESGDSQLHAVRMPRRFAVVKDDSQGSDGWLARNRAAMTGRSD
jgi:hypothetical protein